jgi:hypothetical protein
VHVHVCESLLPRISTVLLSCTLILFILPPLSHFPVGI